MAMMRSALAMVFRRSASGSCSAPAGVCRRRRPEIIDQAPPLPSLRPAAMPHMSVAAAAAAAPTRRLLQVFFDSLAPVAPFLFLKKIIIYIYLSIYLSKTQDKFLMLGSLARLVSCTAARSKNVTNFVQVFLLIPEQGFMINMRLISCRCFV